jgi:flavin-binding protein dodecin
MEEHHVYKHVRLTGTSADSVEDAVQSAVDRAGKTLRNLRWFQVIDTRGHIKAGKVDQWQVTVEIGFKIDDD